MHRLTATIHGWLLLLPAMALLVLFTHWPAAATFIDSFYSTPRPRRRHKGRVCVCFYLNWTPTTS